MKLRQLLAILVVMVAIASCTCRKPTLSDKLTGKWSGDNFIEITMVSNSGNTVIQEFNSPIEIEYFADSTFTAVITVSENNFMKMGGNATFTDSTALLTGSLSCQIMLNLKGKMSLNEDGTMNFNYKAENPTEGLFHNGQVVANPVK
ncbi:MAG: hypothetical protein WCR61_01705 [Bacteroidales bacterium]|nr:hypothetical protein [Bacteroidales bacterium]MDD4656372.1 hypothetical protein [Bacteroidales bacterium]